MKAFQVQEEDEGTATIVWAKTNAQARREGASELNVEWCDVWCRRAPWADDLAHDVRALRRAELANGWWWSFADNSGWTTECSGDPFVDIDGGVWRSPWHWISDREATIRRKVRDDGVRAAATARVLSEWPWAEDIRVHVEPSGAADIWFRLPHLKGPCRWLERNGWTFTIERRDLETFQRAYRINRDCADKNLT